MNNDDGGGMEEHCHLLVRNLFGHDPVIVLINVEGYRAGVMWPRMTQHTLMSYWIQEDWLHWSCQTPVVLKCLLCFLCQHLCRRSLHCINSSRLCVSVPSLNHLSPLPWPVNLPVCQLISLFYSLLSASQLFAVMQLLFVLDRRELLMQGSRRFLEDSHVTSVFLFPFLLTQRLFSRLRLGLIGCISAEC